MFNIVLIVVLAAGAGLYWAFHNFRKVARVRSRSYDFNELDGENQPTAMSVAEVGSIIADGAS